MSLPKNSKRYIFVQQLTLPAPQRSFCYGSRMGQSKNDIRVANLQALVAKEGSQRALADRLGVTPGHISQMLNGTRPITEKTARKIEKRLRLEREWMDRSADDDSSGAQNSPISIREVSEARHSYSEFADMAAQLDDARRSEWKGMWKALKGEMQRERPVRKRGVP
ncbi:MAG: helix-turn-helix domain-containing protein [Gammaproteobacteria bacterium]|nr:helix-turn-helix domain-containing protein [Gammaproteobacteria bacterium]